MIYSEKFFIIRESGAVRRVVLIEKDDKTRKKEDGEALVLFALLMVVLMGIAALVIDVGGGNVTKSKLQNAADAAALAGAQDLPNASNAENTAKNNAELNGVDQSSFNSNSSLSWRPNQD